ncbi:MAG: hypothetical protein EBS90_08880 [Betaproteobacteria bacterium]|nr:hypothetical protein [Betaproteobacteria bacterium]
MDVLCRGLWYLAFDYPGEEFRHFVVELYDNRDGDYAALCCIALQMARRIGGLPSNVESILVLGPSNQYVVEYLRLYGKKGLGMVG